MSPAAHLPRVSVVIETVTIRYDTQRRDSLADELTAAFDGLSRQTYPSDLIEAIVVIGPGVPPEAAGEVTRRFRSARLVEARAANYFAAKNAGAAAASASLVAMLDADCEPDPEWLERLVSGFTADVAVVAGRTRYLGKSLWIRGLSVPSFGYILENRSGAASGFNLNNVAFRADVIRAHPLDERIPRNGGCNLLYHQLRAAGKEIVYEPTATTVHGIDDIRGLHAFSKHYSRGYDGAVLYRLDDGFVLRGTRIFRRFGVAGAAAITASRVLRDWTFMARYRRQVGVPALAAPCFGAITLATRMIEFVGMLGALRQRGGDARHGPV